MWLYKKPERHNQCRHKLNLKTGQQDKQTQGEANPKLSLGPLNLAISE
jgi:hypothetical protein